MAQPRRVLMGPFRARRDASRPASSRSAANAPSDPSHNRRPAAEGIGSRVLPTWRLQRAPPSEPTPYAGV
eukprot:350869-Chlamydomonas_euryale.AAC.6